MKWVLKSENVYSGDLLSAILELRKQSTEDLALEASYDLLTDYKLMPNITLAAKQIAQAIKEEKKIYIYGDYDVDGVCATAILWKFLYRSANAINAKPFIPSRFDTGYGLTKQSLDQLIIDGVDLIVTVDCGIRDIDLIEEYKQKGLEFIITDHHQLAKSDSGEPILPNCTVVHPRIGETFYPTAEICAAMVSWKLCQAIVQELNINFALETDIDLVALATSCDMMPLIKENRIVVMLGLEKIRKNPNLGLAKLFELADINPKDAQSYHLGFVLGPRLNAAGRLESATTALKLLCTENAQTATQFAKQLNELNKKRQDLTLEYLQIAEAQVQSQLDLDRKILFAYGNHWPEGILGLIAGKLSEKFTRPVLVGSDSGEKIVGSARSTDKLHITNLLNELANYLERYGGHAQAAGFTLISKLAEEFSAELSAKADLLLNAEDLEPIIKIDAQINAEAANLLEAKSLIKLEPHGISNPKPNLMLSGITLISQRSFGKNSEHISFSVKEEPNLELIWFGGATLFQNLDLTDQVDAVVQLGINSWRNQEKVQAIVKDMRRAILS